MPAGGERAPEGDHGEGVAGVAEGAEQHPHGGPAPRDPARGTPARVSIAALHSAARQAASSASSRSCSQALGGGEGGGRDPERADAGVAVDGEALADDVGRAAQRDGVDERVGDRGHRLLALAFEVEVLDLLRLGLVAVALDELVVEVLLARAHAADVQGDERAHGVARGLEVVGDAQADGGRDVEVLERFAGALGALLSSGRSSETCSGENSVGIQPSAISPASAVFLGPIAAR